MSSTAKDQDLLRKSILRTRESVPAEVVRSDSAKILRRLTELALYQDAETILVYVSVKNEVQTTDLILDAFSRGKNVAVPKVTGKHEMVFLPIQDLSELRPGLWGLKEPCAEGKAPCRSGFMLMPGLVFDKDCSRIGYGGGFYDSFLHRFRHLVTACALCYDFQVQESSIPTQAWDQKPDMILTPTRLITKDAVTFH